MIEVPLPGRNRTLRLSHLLLDINGTLTVDGELIKGVAERIEALKKSLAIYLLSADTYGRAQATADALGLEFFRVNAETGGVDKRDYIVNLGKEHSAAIGNGFNDILMLEEAALAIAVMGREGCCSEALLCSDLVVADINDALDILLNPRRLVATLRA
ncbi:MAG: ATPase P [Syntrophomonas sp.]